MPANKNIIIHDIGARYVQTWTRRAVEIENATIDLAMARYVEGHASPTRGSVIPDSLTGECRAAPVRVRGERRRTGLQ